MTKICLHLPHHVLLCPSLHASGKRDQAGVDTRTEPVPGPAAHSIDCLSLSPEHAVSSAIRDTLLTDIHDNNIQDIWAEKNGYRIWCKELHGRKVSFCARS